MAAYESLLEAGLQLLDGLVVLWANAFAGFYAMIFWGYFGILHLIRGRWATGIGQVALSAGSLIAGLAFLALRTGGDPPVGLFIVLQGFVAPLLVLPVTMYLSQWRAAIKMIHEVDEIHRELEDRGDN